jgi:acyl-coenzyme A synthetase/AMP-(fatty) acid ligase
MHEAMAKERPFCAPEMISGEDPLFLLYTSGSTGKPKGMMHSSAGVSWRRAVATGLGQHLSGCSSDQLFFDFYRRLLVVGVVHSFLHVRLPRR